MAGSFGETHFEIEVKNITLYCTCSHSRGAANGHLKYVGELTMQSMVNSTLDQTVNITIVLIGKHDTI